VDRLHQLKCVGFGHPLLSETDGKVDKPHNTLFLYRAIQSSGKILKDVVYSAFLGTRVANVRS
jgi:hypothetical protein